jgi:Concanavalin A-like lectin/glucanases superfamily
LLYTNGALAASVAIPVASGITNSSETPMSIGARSSSPANGFDQQFPGTISDVAVYNYALSAAQVAAHYDASGIVPPVNTTPTNLVFAITNNVLYLSWPANHIGWQLQAQTNKASVGISTNWANYNPSTSTDQVAIPINVTNGTVFYRLIYTP